MAQAYHQSSDVAAERELMLCTVCTGRERRYHEEDDAQDSHDTIFEPPSTYMVQSLAVYPHYLISVAPTH